MTTSRFVAMAPATMSRWINYGLEGLWLLMVLLVPLVFLGREYAVSEAVIAFVEVPKIALLRVLAALMASLWLVDWATKGLLPANAKTNWNWVMLWPTQWWPRLTDCLMKNPGNWISLAACLFLATTLLSTVLSGSQKTSLWGEIPGQDGYPAYTVVAYLVAFGTIVTHLKTRSQVCRLLGVVVVMGLIVATYGVLQRYGLDIFDLTVATGGGSNRIQSFMGNTIFAAAVMSMTIPVTLALAVASVGKLAWRTVHGRLKINEIFWEAGLTVSWGLILAVQLLGITFTLSRGPWVGTLVALAIFMGLLLLCLGIRFFWRAALVLGLAAIFGVAFLQLMGTISMQGQPNWSGLIIALLGVGGVVAVIATRRYLGRTTMAMLGMVLVIVLGTAVILGPSSFGNIGSSTSVVSEYPTNEDRTSSGEIAAKLSSIHSTAMDGFVGGRSTHWKVSWDLISNRPWFAFDDLSSPWLRLLWGYGPDLFRYTYLLRSPGEGPQLLPLEPDHAHNFFIHQTVEQGFLGLVSALGLFLAVLVTGACQLLRRGLEYSIFHKVILTGLVATIAGRSVEMMVGVARVSDLTVLWVLLAICAALPVVMKDRGETVAQENAESAPHLPEIGKSSQLVQTSFKGGKSSYKRLCLRAALAVCLIGGISVLTWVKGVNYVRAAVEEGEGLKSFAKADLQATVVSFDRAIELAPDVPFYHTNRGQLFRAFQINEDIPPEQGCASQSNLPYRVCLATQSFQSYVDGASQRPFYYRTRLALADSASDLGLGDPTIRFYTDASLMVPASWQFKNHIANAFLSAGRPNDALRILEESLQITQGTNLSAFAFYLQGKAYQALSHPGEGAKSIVEALELNPGASWGLESIDALIEYYSALGTGESLDRLNQVIENNPKHALAHYIRGRVSAQTDQPAQALDDFSHSINLGLSDFDVYLWRGRMAQLLGYDDVAKLHLTNAVRIDPLNAENYAYLGDFHRSTGTYFEAVQNLEQALRLDPELALAYYFRALIHKDLNLYERAVRDFDQALTLDPGMVEVLDSQVESFRKMEISTQSGLPSHTIDVLASSYSPELSEPELFVWKGLMDQALGREGSLHNLAQAIHLLPENAIYYSYLGNARRAHGLIEQSREVLEHAIDLDPQLPLAYHFRGLLNLDLDLYQEAIRDFDQAINLNPELADSHTSRAEAYLRLGLFAQSEFGSLAFDEHNRRFSAEFNESELYAWRGRMAQLLGRVVDASRDLDKAVKLDSYSAENYAYLGDFYRFSNQQFEAVENLWEAVRLDPQLGMVYHLRGLLLQNLDLHHKAIEDFNKATGLDSELTEVLNSRAESYRQLDIIAQSSLDHRAFETLSQTFSPEFSEPDHYVWRGLMAQLLGRDDDALRFLSTALNVARGLGTNDGKYLAYLGNYQRSIGKLSVARQNLERAIRSDPRSAIAYYYQGLLDLELRLYDKAIEGFNQSIHLDPNHAPVYKDRSSVYIQQGQHELAIRDADLAIYLDSHLVEAYWFRGQARLAVDQFETAITDFNQVLDMSPGLTEALILRGRALLNIGNNELAAEDLKEVEQRLVLDPSAVWVLDAISTLDVLYSRGNLDVTFSRLNENIVRNPEAAVAYFLRGRHLARTGLVEEALEDLNQSLSLGFDQPEIYFWRGRVLLILGRLDDASNDLTDAVRLDPDNSKYYAYLGEAYRSGKGYFEALQNLGQAVRLDPQLGLTYHFRGLLYHDLNLYGRAIQEFNMAIGLDSASVEPYESREESYTQLDRFTQTEHVTQSVNDLIQNFSREFSRSEFFVWRGRMAHLLEDDQAALRNFNKAILVDVQRAESYAYFGEFYRSINTYFEAKQNLGKAISLDPQLPLAHYFQGLLHHDLGLYDKAVHDFSYAISLDSGLTEALNSMAESELKSDLFTRSGKANRAFEDHSRSFSMEFNEAEMFAWTGRMNQLLGREGSLGNLKRAVQRDPKNAIYHAYLGDARRYNGLMPESRETLDKAISLDPRLSLAHHFQGLYYHDSGLFQDAIRSFDQAINLDPMFAQAYEGRGGTYIELGLYSFAIGDLNQAIILDERLTNAYLLRGTAHFQLQEYDAAVTDLSQALDINDEIREGFILRGSAFIALGRNEEASQDLERAEFLEAS